MLVAFPLVYHSAAGIRHLYWDRTAKGLDLQSVELSSKALLIGAGVVSFLLGFYSLPSLK
jgi:succinate dehydrogenase/fumarate reductase cytochrome b subunit